MKILYLTGEFPPMRGSVGDHTARLATAVAAQGHEVAVLTARQAQGAALSGVTVYPVVQSWGIGAWRRVAQIARRYDVLHIEYQAGAFGMGVPMQFMADAVRQQGGTPVVTTFHDLLVPYLFPKAGPLRRWSLRHLARASQGVIATNDEDATTLRAWGVRRLATVPIASPLPLETSDGWQREAWRTAWGVAPDEKLIVHYGFLNRAKGVEYLLDAFATLRDSGLPVRLLMAGDPLGASDPANVAYMAEIEARATSLGLAPPAMQWTGDLDEKALIEAVLGADLIVLPFREGASLRRSTLIMALSLGQPVVTTEPRSALPLLRDGENVVLVPRDDATALATRLRALLSDEAALVRLRAGTRELGQHFDWDAIAAQTIAMYEALPSPPLRSAQ